MNQNECESGHCITSSTPSICASSSVIPRRLQASTGSNQYIYLNFAPHLGESELEEYESWIIAVLERITKIESQYWRQYAGTQGARSPTDDTYIEITCQIENNEYTNAKIMSLQKMLRFDDGEQFTILFNDFIRDYLLDVYIIDMYGMGVLTDSGIDGQENVLDLSMDPFYDKDELLGFGALYATGTEPRFFCTNSVC